MERSKRPIIVIVSICAALLLALFVCDLFKVSFFSNNILDRMAKDTLTRALGSVVLIALICFLRYRIFGFEGFTLKNILLVSPLFLVAFNNFPFLDFFGGRLGVLQLNLLFPFLLQCLFVALFEELLFRGLVFSYCLKNRRASKKDELLAILISSAVFGLFHLLNLFSGSGAGAVAMQVGYSFLMGAALCLILLKTGNIFLCALFHAVYNFGGLLYPTLGGGNIWSAETIVLTAIVGGAVVLYALSIFFKTEKFYFSNLLRENRS